MIFRDREEPFSLQKHSAGFQHLGSMLLVLLGLVALVALVVLVVLVALVVLVERVAGVVRVVRMTGCQIRTIIETSRLRSRHNSLLVPPP